MDTITHGIAGALIGKAVFGGDELLTFRPMNVRRVITWSAMIGAIFPDSDTLRDIFSHNDLLLITWHRSITHSLVCLPIFAFLLAALTRGVCRYFRWESPSFALLTILYAVGILSHIVLDLVTTYGTMIWSPLGWSRPAWDIIFIVDFTLTGLLLLPQFLAWVYAEKEKWKQRALGTWLASEFALLVVSAIARIVGAPISPRNITIVGLLLTCILFLPARYGWGMRISQATWNFGGLVAAGVYIGLAACAHHVALERIKAFTTFEHLEVLNIGALPLPPSLWHWDGLVQTPRGVYDWRIDLSEKSAIAPAVTTAPAKSAVDASVEPALEYKFYPEAPDNNFIERARQLPDVQKVLWFARFPVIRFHQEGSDAVVEILDKRFPQIRPDHPAPFTYRVRFDAADNVLSQGWER